MKFEILKGTRDFDPKLMIKINSILDIIRKNFESYGIRPFDTPIIEFLDVLTNKYEGDCEIVGEIYKLSDRGNRKLGLRYDLTLPLCRYVASKKQLKLPFRRYSIGKVFRDGPLKSGRLREFIQCDADIVGTYGVSSEAELLDLFFKTYLELGIDPIIELNNNKILKGAFMQAGFLEKDLSKLILSVDKLKKIGMEGVLDEIKNKGLDSKKAKIGIDILNLKDFSSIEKIAKNDLLMDGILELKNLTKLLKSLKIEFRTNFSMSRGLDIYTGNLWEAYSKSGKIKSSIGAGGRYDKIIGEFMGSSEIYPAIGISFGLVPILSIIENDLEDKEGITDILIIPMNENLSLEVFKIANELRSDGNNVEIDYSYKLKKSFKYADYLGVSKIIVFGEKDLENGEYKIKDLKTKDEKVITLE